MTEAALAQEVLRVLDSLEELTLRMHEAVAFDKFEELSLLVGQRQDLIAELEDFDASSRGASEAAVWTKKPKLRNKIDKLILSGDALLSTCSRRLESMSKARRQRSVTRASLRGYKPYSPSPISTRKLES